MFNNNREVTSGIEIHIFLKQTKNLILIFPNSDLKDQKWKKSDNWFGIKTVEAPEMNYPKRCLFWNHLDCSLSQLPKHHICITDMKFDIQGYNNKIIIFKFRFSSRKNINK